MHCLLLTLALLLVKASLGVASAHQMFALDYLTQRAASDCTKAGIICSSDCSTVILCVSDGLGGFESVDIETCSGDTTCSAEEATCVTDSLCGVTIDGPINCHDRAILPDPFNCTVYHICMAVNIESIPKACKEGYAYNPLTSDCSCLTSDPVCTEGPVPACTSVGQTGALATNPSIYYICIKSDNILIPEIYKCPNGEVYDSATYSCYDPRSPTAPTGSSENTPSTSSTTSTTTSTSTTTTQGSPADPPTPGGYCSPLLQMVADPVDCTRFYQCGPGNTWRQMSCISGYYFNPANNRCEVGTC